MRKGLGRVPVPASARAPVAWVGPWTRPKKEKRKEKRERDLASSCLRRRRPLPRPRWDRTMMSRREGFGGSTEQHRRRLCRGPVRAGQGIRLAATLNLSSVRHHLVGRRRRPGEQVPENRVFRHFVLVFILEETERLSSVRDKGGRLMDSSKPLHQSVACRVERRAMMMALYWPVVQSSTVWPRR